MQKKKIYICTSIISNNKNNNYNSNNNDLKDGQNHRLGKKFEFEKETGQVHYAFEEALHDKQLKKYNGTYSTCHGLLSQEWTDGRY